MLKPPLPWEWSTVGEGVGEDASEGGCTPPPPPPPPPLGVDIGDGGARGVAPAPGCCSAPSRIVIVIVVVVIVGGAYEWRLGMPERDWL